MDLLLCIAKKKAVSGVNLSPLEILSGYGLGLISRRMAWSLYVEALEGGSLLPYEEQAVIVGHEDSFSFDGIMLYEWKKFTGDGWSKREVLDDIWKVGKPWFLEIMLYLRDMAVPFSQKVKNIDRVIADFDYPEEFREVYSIARPPSQRGIEEEWNLRIDLLQSEISGRDRRLSP